MFPLRGYSMAHRRSLFSDSPVLAIFLLTFRALFLFSVLSIVVSVSNYSVSLALIVACLDSRAPSYPMFLLSGGREEESEEESGRRWYSGVIVGG